MSEAEDSQSKAGQPDARDATRIEFDAELAGRRATCDGGNSLPGAVVGARETFVGTLSGRRMLYGDPPWRWLELVDAVQEAEGTLHDQVWCDEACVFLDD